MISFIKGKIVRKTASGALIEHSGLGFFVLLSQRALERIGEGMEAEFFTAVIYRNEAFEIFGFENYEELEVFELLRRIDSVGPRLAFKLIGTLGVDGIFDAVQKKNSVALERVPGIGKKTASKILVELVSLLDASKLAPLHLKTDEVETAREALLQLGVSREEIARVFAELDFTEYKTASEIVREALKIIGAGK